MMGLYERHVGSKSPTWRFFIVKWLEETNHILPTCETARYSSGLSVLDFVRGYSVIHYTKEALLKNGNHIKKLAEPEGMKAHMLSVEVRLDEQIQIEKGVKQ